MKLLVGGRRAGKTYKVIEAMRTDPAIVMICFSHQSADICKKEYPDVADRILPPVKEHLQGFHTKRKYILDNADILLENLLGTMLYGATMTAAVTEIKVNE